MYNRENVKGYKNPEGRLIHFELTELDDMYKLVPRKYKSKEGQLKLVQDDWGNTSDGVESASFKHKSRYNMDPAYERFLQSEKNIELNLINNQFNNFESVALQIRKGVPLDSIQAQVWVRHNFLNFREKEKDEIIEMFRRRNNMRLFLIILFPVSYTVSFSYFKRYKKIPTSKSMFISTFFSLIPCFILHYPSQKKLNDCYLALFNKYKTVYVPKTPKESLNEADAFQSDKINELRGYIQKLMNH